MKTYNEILNRLQKVFSDSCDQFRLTDDVGDDRHFSLTVISDRFKDKSRIERSQMIHEVLKGLMKDDAIHALSLKLKTLDEFSNKN